MGVVELHVPQVCEGKTPRCELYKAHMRVDNGLHWAALLRQPKALQPVTHSD